MVTYKYVGVLLYVSFYVKLFLRPNNKIVCESIFFGYVQYHIAQKKY